MYFYFDSEKTQAHRNDLQPKYFHFQSRKDPWIEIFDGQADRKALQRRRDILWEQEQ